MKPTALPLSNAAVNAMRLAQDEAQRLGHRHIGTGHALLGVARSTNNSLPSNANELLASQGFDVAAAQRILENIMGIGANSPVREIPLDHRLQDVLSKAEKIATSNGESFISTLDILEAMSETRTCDGAEMLKRSEFDPSRIREPFGYSIVERSSAQPFAPPTTSIATGKPSPARDF